MVFLQFLVDWLYIITRQKSTSIGCGVAMWLLRRVRIPPGTPPPPLPSAAQENPGAGMQWCRLFPVQQQEIPAKQQAVTKE